MTTLIQNRKARHNYHFLEKYEAGIALMGTEVKACRAATISLAEAYAIVKDGEVWLLESHISHYKQGNINNHDPKRPRKLLLNKREIIHLKKSIEAKGLSLIPVRFYLSRGKVKVELALARGKQKHDKRDTLRKRDHDRETARAISAHH